MDEIRKHNGHDLSSRERRLNEAFARARRRAEEDGRRFARRAMIQASISIVAAIAAGYVLGLFVLRP